MRLCKTCGQEREDSDFREGHHRSDCRICRANYAREYYRQHPEFAVRQRSRKRAAWAKNPEPHRARVQAWKKANPEKKKEQDRRYRTAHPEKIREHTREYRQRHYVPHPRKPLSEEERKRRNRESDRRQYYKDLAKSREQSRLNGIRYRTTYPEKERAKLKRWRRNNPEKKLRQNSIDALRKYANTFWSPPEELIAVETERRLLRRRLNNLSEAKNG